MISYIRHNSVFDLGTRTGVSSCEGLYAELEDIYSKFINPQVRVQYETNASSVDCLCNMSGKQTLSGNIHAFIFQNGIITVTVGEDDTVTVAEVSSGGGGGGVMYVNLTYDSTDGDFPYRLDKTYNEILTAIQSGTLVIIVDRTERTDYIPIALTAVSYHDEDEDADAIVASGSCASYGAGGSGVAHVITITVFPRDTIYYLNT